MSVEYEIGKVTSTNKNKPFDIKLYVTGASIDARNYHIGVLI